MNSLERFLACMEYEAVDSVPNYEVGVWGQTTDRWETEGLDPRTVHWDWFVGSPEFGMDPREYLQVDFGMVPPFEHEVLDEDERHLVFRDRGGVVRKALKEGTAHGTRASMDQYLSFPVSTVDDFRKLQRRFDPSTPARYPAYWKERLLPCYGDRTFPLILGTNTATTGFYWRAREWMGTEALSFAWYDEPDLMHEMCEFIADFLIETARPALEAIDFDYLFLNEDMAMKQGPLLSPDTYRTFIFPHMKRLVDFLKSNGVRYVVVDSDGNTEPLIPLLLEAGVDAIWPIERASIDMDPVALRKRYGRELRLWGGVDKRELAKGPDAIDAHLAELVPLVEEGGFIPTVDHLVPPDVSLGDFRYYMERKALLLRGAWR